ncbi:MAG TPA: hypothetical protein VKE22_11500 [Haliangiales bacterium]|nr:hypothetical protein [Haliangiales bacterium]
MTGKEPKERILHTRIPAGLEEQIKRLAERLRVPVSNLVRNMLEDAIDVTKRMRDRFEGTDDVYGWQDLTLNIAVPCSKCQRQLARGERAHVGLTHHPRDSKVFICSTCLDKKE